MTQIQYGMGIASVRNDEKKNRQQHVHVYVLLCIWKKKNRLMKTACSIRFFFVVIGRELCAL